MTTLSLAMIGLALLIPQVDAQGRNSHNGKNETHQVTTGNRNNRGKDNKNHGVTTRPSNRPGNNNQNVRRPDNNRPGNNHGVGNRPDNNRPSNNHNWGNGNNRPSNNHNWGNGNNRPGNNHGVGNRPDNNRPGNNHNWGNGNNRPSNNWHFGGNHRPPMDNHHPGFGAPPVRPHRPVVQPWRPPVPPQHWRPRPHAPNIATILGVTFGTALNISLNYLVNNGYAVDGYANNTVYLRDINQFNYYWPDATLYYSNGGLARSEFLYSTSYPDMMRYNSLFNSFMMTYGNPVNVSNGAAMSATWFAPNRGYITLNYGPQYSLGGQLRYFTTLTIGM